MQFDEGHLLIQTSEQWHRAKYGEPEKCYQSYLENKSLIIDKEHTLNKWIVLANLYPFGTSSIILDLGSTGMGDMCLLYHCPHITKIVAIDGNKKEIKAYKPCLDKRIEVIVCDFYRGELPDLDTKFDTVLQIDFPEHLPDEVWERVTQWSITQMVSSGMIFLYTPSFPRAADQIEHISVKSLGYFLNFFRDRMRMPVMFSTTEDSMRIFLIAINSNLNGEKY